MQMQSNGNGNHKYSQFCNDNNYCYYNDNDSEIDQLLGFYNNRSNGISKDKKSPTKLFPFSSTASPSPSPSPPPPAPPPSSSTVSISSGGIGFIEHPVSRFDTLAGVAIKYGVEVADIKKMNGLVTDLQMFALKSLQIPLPGRHPPSPCLSNVSNEPRQNNSEQTPPRRVHSDFFDSFQSLRLKSSERKVSPAMSSLQGYYGLKPTDPKITTEGFEMAAYRKGDSHYLEDVQYVNPSPASNLPLSCHRKSRSLVNGFLEIDGDKFLLRDIREGDSEKWNEKLVRRRQKPEADFSSNSPEMLMREDNSSGGAFSVITGRGLAMRSKAANRTALSSDAEASGLTPVPIGLGDSLMSDGFSGVRKSSSTPSLHDQEGSSSSIWSTSKWNLKPDLQGLSAAAITRPIFDGLPKPITGRKSKAALD